MGRTIKFRVWDSSIQKFRRANISGKSAWGVNIDHGIFSVEPSRNLTIQEFTGLTDKNGKEIYEGDIIFWPQEGKRYEIFFDSKTASFSRRNVDKIGLEGNEHSWELWEMVGIEVIGNIFETTNLLK